jgi:hypothetical protein
MIFGLQRAAGHQTSSTFDHRGPRRVTGNHVITERAGHFKRDQPLNSNGTSGDGKGPVPKNLASGGSKMGLSANSI